MEWVRPDRMPWGAKESGTYVSNIAGVHVPACGRFVGLARRLGRRGYAPPRGLLGESSAGRSDLQHHRTQRRGRRPRENVEPASAIGAGRVKVALILPLSAAGNAAVAAQSMRNAAEMALAEFNNPDLQLLVKDDGGSAQGAQQAAQQALDEGAEIILGPLFALTVGPVGQLARARAACR